MQSTHENLSGGTVAPGAAGGIDPFELPDTIQLGDVADPYPQLAAARRRAPVGREWPLSDQLIDADPGAGHDDSGQAVNVTARSTNARMCGCIASTSLERNDFWALGISPS